MTKNPPNTRREVQALAPEILGHYHDMLMANDFEGFKKLLEIYCVPQESREELCREFTHCAEKILRQKWRGRK
jgi:hypothetical protein